MQIQITKYLAFGLVEVLISVVVLSIGLLGLASLQNRTIQSVQEGDNLITAANLAQEISKRMLSNPYNLSLGRQGYLALDLTNDIASAGGVMAWADGVESGSPDILNCYAADDSESCVPSGGSLNNSANHITALNNMQLMDQVEMRRLAWTVLPEGEIKLCFDSSSSLDSWNCNNTATRINSRNENVFTVKVRWKNILTNATQVYALQFTGQCTNGNSDYCGN